MAEAPGFQRIRPRPLSVVEVLRGTFRIYRRGFAAFIVAIGVVSVPETMITLIWELIPGQVDGISVMRLTRDILSLLGGTLSAGIYVLTSGAVIVISVNLVLGHTVRVVEAYREAARRVVPLLVAGLLTLLAGFCVTCIAALPFLAYARDGTLDPSVAFLLTLVVVCVTMSAVALPGWILAFPIVLLERSGAIDALRRSWGMAQWHRRRLLACVVLISIVEMMVYSTPSCLLTFGYSVDIRFETCWGSEPAPTPLKIGDVLLRGISGTLTQALLPIVMTLLYYDLRVSEERLDLDLRAAVAGRSAD